MNIFISKVEKLNILQYIHLFASLIKGFVKLIAKMNIFMSKVERLNILQYVHMVYYI